MEYRDVHHVLPDTFQWRTPSPGSYKPSSDHCYDQGYFKWDYKKSYKDSPHYIRANIMHEREFKNYLVTNIEFTKEDVESFSKRIPEFKRIE